MSYDDEAAGNSIARRRPSAGPMSPGRAYDEGGFASKAIVRKVPQAIRAVPPHHHPRPPEVVQIVLSKLIDKLPPVQITLLLLTLVVAVPACLWLLRSPPAAVAVGSGLVSAAAIFSVRRLRRGVSPKL